MRHLFYSAGTLLLLVLAFSFRPSSPQKVCFACEQLTGLEKVVCLAEDFKASLTSTQLSAAQLDHTFANAKKWSNLPVTLAPRIGVRFGDLSAAQLAKAKTLIEASMGTGANEGYKEMQQLWAADKYLSQNGGGATYGDGQYFLAFLGTPSTTGSWELQTGGHHLAVANTYGGGQMKGATPSFRAVEPFAAFTIDGGTYQPIVQERDALAAMLASLSTAQLAAAKLSTTYNDIVLGPNSDWAFPSTKSGLRANQLSTAQKELITKAILTYVGDIDSANASAYMAIYTAQLDDTYIAYANNATLSQKGDYVRIDGPRVWIEYSVQNGIILTPTHPHSVWRDHQSDYGGLGNPSATHAPQRFEGVFEVSPNPVSEQTQVKIELDQPAVIRVQVLDGAGHLVPTGFRYNMTAGTHILPLVLSGLPAGLYTCTLEVSHADGSSVATASRQMSKI
ncbi:MAG TPA: DUF3500 domain-containing protein [Saprospiraceae bacterium]|nr:DUF3500 domain-containing protein [Saprospiraceae bacterium]